MEIRIMLVEEKNLGRFDGKLPFELKDIRNENSERVIIAAMGRETAASVPVGACWGYVADEKFILENVYVDPSFRNGGIGKFMVDRFISAVENTVIDRVCCSIDDSCEDREAALALFFSCGFSLKERKSLAVSIKASDVLRVHDRYEYLIEKQIIVPLKDAAVAKISPEDAKTIKKAIVSFKPDRDVSCLYLNNENEFLGAMFVSPAAGEGSEPVYTHEGTYMSVSVRGDTLKNAIACMLAEEICKKIIEKDGPKARIIVSSDKDRLGGFTVDLMEPEEINVMTLEMEREV